MRLTTKGRYAVTAMLDIALHGDGCAVSVSDISRRQRISQSYLERLFGRLHRSQLVKSVHGPGGGYLLASEPGGISIADIIHAVDETVDATQCHGQLNCHDGERCMTHELWAELNMEINRYLASVTLAQLVASQHAKSAAESQQSQQWMPVSIERSGAAGDGPSG
ncbi:Rrf2 family transcriptional regulator [Noviherbaspirillum cavernae]|uniref:Rrf2 family transcriptional regulator n=1 Tax=Noviherbaspirillum cavernae TaxID=2320862 RepID=A0A418X2F1_9BURK|nr:Rrf2 family transcriptional regulator [Noviherbaspirillum cavernae]RJG06647.1 Rrf2 family transcriptional regulator [Noviherbaspirillum cavernae]